MNIDKITYSNRLNNNLLNAKKVVSVQNCSFKSSKVSASNVSKANLPFEKFLRFILKTFCKPTRNDMNYMIANLYNLNYINHYGIDEAAIAKISKILDMYSKNSEYADFVKEGIDFLQKNKSNENLYYCPSKVYGNILDEGGNDLRFIIGLALEKAVMPKSKAANETRLKEFITRSREYMNAFSERGEHIYPQGFMRLQ